jgi:predicted nucleic acid-binding protein
MMTMVANRLFIDTNILIYANASDYVLQADGIPNILTHNVGDFTRYQAEGINVLPLTSEV